MAIAPRSHTPSTPRTWGSSFADADVAVIAVHGRSQTPDFMRNEATRLTANNVRFYAPSAPGNSWYPLPFLEPLEGNEPALSASLATLDSCVSDVLADGFCLDQVVLWGFSQGACLIAHFALTHPRTYGALAIFTGGFIGPEAVVASSQLALENVPVLMRSIDRDPWVPRVRVEATADAFSAAGASVDLRIDAGEEHVVTQEAIDSLTGLLGTFPPRRLSGPGGEI